MNYRWITKWMNEWIIECITKWITIWLNKNEWWILLVHPFIKLSIHFVIHSLIHSFIHSIIHNYVWQACQCNNHIHVPGNCCNKLPDILENSSNQIQQVPLFTQVYMTMHYIKWVTSWRRIIRSSLTYESNCVLIRVNMHLETYHT